MEYIHFSSVCLMNVDALTPENSSLADECRHNHTASRLMGRSFRLYKSC